MKEITDKLEAGIQALFESEQYKNYLTAMSKFHNYSFSNTLLIAMQKPDASLVAGYNKWRDDFERHVKRGEKAIKILAPAPYKVRRQVEKLDANGKTIPGPDGKPLTEEKEITVPAFKVVSVFDVSQTEGREIPDIAVDELTGSVERYQDFFAALERTSPVPIAFEQIESGAHGYYHLKDKRIAIDEGMSELQTLKTTIHEIAHAKLHDIDLNAPKDEQADKPQRTREVQAESVAYAVCQHYGLDTSDYSFGYIAGWSSGRELDELKASLETIRSAAVEIISDIDGHFPELKKERGAEKKVHQEPEKPQGMETSVPEKANSLEQAQVPAAQGKEPMPSEATVPDRTPTVRRISGIDHGISGMCEDIAIWEIRNRIPADQRLTCRFNGCVYIPRAGVSGEMIEQKYNELRNMKAAPVKDLLATAQAEAGRRNADRIAVEQKPQRNERSI